MVWLLFEAARKEYAMQNQGERGTYVSLRGNYIAIS